MMKIKYHPEVHDTWVPGATSEYIRACNICNAKATIVPILQGYIGTEVEQQLVQQQQQLSVVVAKPDSDSVLNAYLNGLHRGGWSR